MDCFKFLRLALTAMILLAFQPSQARDVRLEWGEVEGASAYDIEIRSLQNKKVISFKTKTTFFNRELPYGKYELRLRSRDERSVPGSWSPYTNFDVKPAPPVITEPLANTKYNPKSSEEDEVEVQFKWQALPNVKEYKFGIYDSEQNEITESETEELSTTYSLDIKKDYIFKVYAVTSGDIEGEVSEVAFSVFGGKLNKPEIKYSWITANYIKWDGDEKTELFEFESPTTAKTKKKKWLGAKKLKNGVYTLKLRSSANKYTPSDWLEQKFRIQNRRIYSYFDQQGKEHLIQKDRHKIRAGLAFGIVDQRFDQIDENSSIEYSGEIATGLNIQYNFQIKEQWGLQADLIGQSIEINNAAGTTPIQVENSRLRVMGTYKWAEFGLFSHSFTEVYDFDSLGDLDSRKIQSQGIVLGANWGKKLNEKISYDLFANYHRILKSEYEETEGSIEIAGEHYLEFGVEGTYKWKDKGAFYLQFKMSQIHLSYPSQDGYSQESVLERNSLDSIGGFEWSF